MLTFKEELHNEFKKFFTKNLNQGNDLSFQNVLSDVQRSYSIENINNDDLTSAKEWHNNIYNFAYLEELVAKKNICEIIVHDSCTIQVEINGVLQTSSLDISNEILQLSLEVFARMHNCAWNYKSPFISVYTKINDHHFRATLLHFSLTPDKSSKLFLRRIVDTPHSIQSFAIDDATEKHIKESVSNKKNILIAGHAGSGKTSLLRSMLQYTDKSEHIVILEDTREINFQRRFTTNLIADTDANSDLRAFCAYTLRIRPDRIILGEIRSNEIIPFMLAINTGHKGVMTTVHADSSIDALYRLALMFNLYSSSSKIELNDTMKLICKSIDLVIQIDKKKIVEIINVFGAEGSTPIYEYLYKATY